MRAYRISRQAGVIAAISGGYKELYEKSRTSPAVSIRSAAPPGRASWPMCSSRSTNPSNSSHASGMIEKEQIIPRCRTARQTFSLVVDIVAQCQQAGILRTGASDLTVSAPGH